MDKVKGPYNGVLQIVVFNWPFYLAALAFVGIAFFVLLSFVFPLFLKILLALGIFLSLFWIFSSLIASYWIYDKTFTADWSWVKTYLEPAPKTLGQFHAGFDETSGILRKVFPNVDWRVADIHPQNEKLTASLERARQNQNAVCPRVDSTCLPFESEIFSAIFLIFSAHELRKPETRTQFFSELYRILQNKGRVLMVEHLRDFANFAAFGPNFVHFYSRKEWLRCIHSVSFKIVKEFRKTPFVRVFILEK